jgi:TPR repeat protein
MSASDALPPSIDRYEVIDRLGHGGMGVVYLGKDPLLGRPVAIKVLSVDADSLRQRFLQEARLAATLRHPNIVTIFDYGDWEGRPFIVMEQIEGETIADTIERRMPWPIDRKLDLLCDLAKAIDYANERAIIHRDVKPANLMVDAGGVLKVLDFGIARAAHSDLTQSGMMIGTPNYMSPEQIEGRPVDRRTDVFAVGVTAYELLSYRKAFPGNTSVIRDILTSDPVPLTTILADLHPELDRIIRRAIEKDPSKRYQTLGAMAADLAACLRRYRGHETPRPSQEAGWALPTISAPSPDVDAMSENAETVDGSTPTPRAAATDHPALVRACDSLANGRFESAIAAAAEVLAVDPGNVQAKRVTSVALQALGLGGQPASSRGTPPPQLPEVSVTTGAPYRPVLYAGAAIALLAAAVFAGFEWRAASTLGPNQSAVTGGTPPQASATDRGPLPPTSGLAAAERRAPAEAAPGATTTTADSSQTRAAANRGRGETVRERAAVDPALARREELAFWESIGPITDPAQQRSLLQEYERRYGPSGRFSAIARQRIAAIDGAGSTAAAAATASTSTGAAASSGGATASPSTGAASGASSLAADGYQRACDGGESNACSQLADMYAQGRGVPMDLARAIALYLRACDRGLNVACARAAGGYRAGSGVQKDSPRAVALFQRSCDLRGPNGCIYLGDMYENGEGVERDQAKAIAAFQRGCDLNPNNCFAMGFRYQMGRGVVKDEARASALYQRSCDAGNRDACRNLARLYQDGLGVTKDTPRAASLYRRACDAGDSRACDAIASSDPQDRSAGPASEDGAWMPSDRYRDTFFRLTKLRFYPAQVQGRFVNGREEFRADWKKMGPQCRFASYHMLMRKAFDDQAARLQAQGYALSWSSQFIGAGGLTKYQATWTRLCD